MFLDNPWVDESLPSLVYEQSDGKLLGFLGVVPRRFVFQGKEIQAATTSQLMVDPASRSTMAGLQLVKKFLAGTQDLSIVDHVTHDARQIWEFCGAQTVWLYNLRWRMTLRRQPLTRRMSSVLPARLGFICKPLTALEESILGKNLIPERSLLKEAEIDVATMIPNFERLKGRVSLAPVYDENSLSWILRRASHKQLGKLQMVGVTDDSGTLAGWYIYYLNPGGGGEVLHVVSDTKRFRQVFHSALRHAWERGAVSLFGRMEPRYLAKPGLIPGMSFYNIGAWAVIHSHNPKVLSAIHSGDAFFTELDGEHLLNPFDETFE